MARKNKSYGLIESDPEDEQLNIKPKKKKKKGRGYIRKKYLDAGL